MRNRSTWLVSVIAVSVCAVLVIGAAVPFAFAAPKGKPGVTPPGVPPGQPFQALQKQIDALAVRVKALEDAAPQPGLMWINPLDFVAVAGAPAILAVAGPGLQVTGAIGDVVQVGLQVPLGFAVTGARLCYNSALASSVNVQLLQDTDPPGVSAGLLGSSSSATAPPVVCVDTTLTSSVDPSAGGAMSLWLTFTAADTIVIRSVGLSLTP
jgi:hypothetical protein